MTTTDYRWNELDNARGYDQAAEHVHPYYREIQDVIIDHLPLDEQSAGWVVDLGGGSGRLAERILMRWPSVCVCVVDQSQPFLTLAAQRLARFGSRAICLCERLQNKWSRELPDCHETAETQLGYFAAAGLADTKVLWRRDLWSVLYGQMPKE